MLKVKKSLVEKIIKEESIKIKQLIVLQEEKNNIIKQLDELYEEEIITEVNWADAADVTQNYIAYWDKKFQDPKFKRIPRPKWTQMPEDPGFKSALAAAIQNKTFDIYYHPTKKQFLPRQYSAATHTFGSGAGAGE
jgi:hypothetical protein